MSLVPTSSCTASPNLGLRLVLFHGLNLLSQMWVSFRVWVDGERVRGVEELSHELGIGSEVCDDDPSMGLLSLVTEESLQMVNVMSIKGMGRSEICQHVLGILFLLI